MATHTRTPTHPANAGLTRACTAALNAGRSLGESRRLVDDPGIAPYLVHRVELEPAAATRYEITLVPPMAGLRFNADGTCDPIRPKDWLVTVNGRSYAWTGEASLAAEYAADKWADGNIWTGEIISSFLYGLAHGIAGTTPPQAGPR